MDYSNNESFERWRKSLTKEDLERAQEAITTAKRKKLQEVKAKPVERSSSTRGPKPKSTSNPLYKHLIWAEDTKFQTAQGYSVKWFDDFVYGACYVAAGISSSGELNVSPGHVRYALMMPEISTASCKTEDMEERTAQRVAQATRYALSGIQSLLANNPTAFQELATTKKIEEMTCYDSYPQPYSDSLDLYYAGEYESYGIRRREEISGVRDPLTA